MTDAGPPPAFDATRYTVRELLDTYVEILDELNDRGIVRSRNPPIGDLAETIALRAYGGALEKNSKKSYDILTADNLRIQVKARAQVATDKRTQTFSAFRSFDFDIAVFIVFDSATYDIVWASELTGAETSVLGSRREHTNSTAINIRHVLPRGEDVTKKLTAAYDRIDEPAD